MTGPIIEPPAQYQQYPGKLYVHEIEAARIDATCRSHDFAKALPRAEIMACSICMANGAACIVILPMSGVGGVGKSTQDALRRHEIAHCNGWPKGHPE